MIVFVDSGLLFFFFVIFVDIVMGLGDGVIGEGYMDLSGKLYKLGLFR